MALFFSDRFVNYVRWTGIFTGIVFLLAGCWLLWANREYSGANHSFLFASPVESFLRANDWILKLAGSLPLALPVMLKRNAVNIVLLAAGIAIFLFLNGVLMIFTD